MPQLMRRRTTPTGNGFTLIELLVVIAIISILAGIVFPVFVKAKMAAQRVSCISNLKQLGNAIKLYQQDFNGRWPGGIRSVVRDPLWRDACWIRILRETYANSPQIFRCPGAAKHFVVGYQVNGVTVEFRSAYCYNEYLCYRDYSIPWMGTTTARFADESGVPRPKFTLLIADGHHTTMVDDWDDDPNNPDAMPPGMDGFPSGMSRVRFADGRDGLVGRVRHDGSNVLFCDMHVKTLLPPQFKVFNYPGWKNKTCKEYPIVFPASEPFL